jgi:cyclohexadieny/prephenate dehydrogenase
MKLAVIGLGLIGMSIVRAYAALGEEAQLYDLDPAVRDRVRTFRIGTVFNDAAAAAEGADLVILCTPPAAMAKAAQALAPGLKAGAILSDVGSVKQAVITAVAPHVPESVFFVPAHPVAGTERSGPDAGFATLFQDRWLLITPLDDPRPDYPHAVDRLARFWESLGAMVETMAPDRHDLVLAVTSHLPHLIAFNIVAMAEDYEKVTESEAVKFSAGGFRDFTRIAASDPTMWRDVFLNNKDALLEILGRFTEDLFALQRAIRWGDGEKIYETIARARRMRREVIEAGQDSAAPNWGRDKS